MCVCVCASIESRATVLPPVQKREEQCPAVHGSPRTPASSGSPGGGAWSNLTLMSANGHAILYVHTLTKEELKE